MCQAVSRPSRVRGQLEGLRMPGEPLGQAGEVALTGGQVGGQLAQLDLAEGGTQLGRLEVPAHLVEDEEVVVLEVAVDLAEEPLVDALGEP